MGENKEITKEIYVKKRLLSEIGELKSIIYELEFSILLITEEKEKLTRRISELENKCREEQENPTI